LKNKNNFYSNPVVKPSPKKLSVVPAANPQIDSCKTGGPSPTLLKSQAVAA
jgi:hypothetical protein